MFCAREDQKSMSNFLLLGEGNANMAFLHHPSGRVVRIGKRKSYPDLQIKFMRLVVSRLVDPIYIGGNVVCDAYPDSTGGVSNTP